MDKYKKKHRWKLNIVFAGVFVVLITIGYTFYLGYRLKEFLEMNMVYFSDDYGCMAQNMDDVNNDVNFETDVLQRNKNIPIIIVDELDSIVMSLTYSESKAGNPGYMRRELERMKASDRKPITVDTQVGVVNRIYYAPPFEYKLMSLLHI